MKKLSVLLLVLIALIAASASSFASSTCTYCDGNLKETRGTDVIEHSIPAYSHSCSYADEDHYMETTTHWVNYKCDRCGYDMTEFPGPMTKRCYR